MFELIALIRSHTQHFSQFCRPALTPCGEIIANVYQPLLDGQLGDYSTLKIYITENDVTSCSLLFQNGSASQSSVQVAYIAYIAYIDFL